MSRSLQVLIVEDNPADAELLTRELRRAGYFPGLQRVDTEIGFAACLHPDLDIILSDYAMPSFSGLRALELLRESGLEIPFILISGTIGEDLAVAAMKLGAADYLLKDRLARLGPAIQQALEQTRLRRERKTLELQFIRAQRMESIGTLAGGIAHDLNNVLAPIIMALDLLKMKFPDSASQELLALVGASAHRGAEMVRQVLLFARGAEGLRTEVQLRHLIEEIGKIFNETFLEHIEVRTMVPLDLWTVPGDPTQLHQVLLNLCVNARDAMPGGGTLTLSAENIRVDAHDSGSTPDTRSGAYVMLQVADSGIGMPPELIEKIFDPFFTTKEIGKGTGLGLSTTQAIVKSHAGFIRVESTLGMGSSFKIHLPAWTKAPSIAALELAATMPRGHGEIILVADDEASVREITRQTLEAFGYRVVLAADGAEAVAAYATRSPEIAAVLIDMTMPVMDGPATIQVLIKINPEVRIIATSGLATVGNLARASGFGACEFLDKPFTAEALLIALRQAIDTEQ